MRGRSDEDMDECMGMGAAGPPQHQRDRWLLGSETGADGLVIGDTLKDEDDDG